MFEVHRLEIPQSNSGFEKHRDRLLAPQPLAIPEPSPVFEKHIDRLPFPLAPLGERAGVRGIDLKPTTNTSHTAQTKKP
jgi:hypothetical protein